jgi:hypothetical protein
MAIAGEGRDGPAAEVAHGMAAVLAQDGMRAASLRIVMHRDQSQGMAVRQLAPGLIERVEVITRAQIQPSQEPTETGSANGLVRPWHITRGDDLDPVPSKPGVSERRNHPVRRASLNRRDDLVERVWRPPTGGRRRRPMTEFVGHVCLQFTPRPLPSCIPGASPA